MPLNWTARAAKSILFLLLIMSTSALSAQKIIDRTVDLQANNVELKAALNLIAEAADFNLSYNSDLIPEGEKVDLFASNSTVKELLDQLLGEGMTYKQSGEHLIILGPKSAKHKLKLNGRIFDLKDRRPIEGVTILEVDEVNATRSGPNGNFEMTISGKRNPTGLLVVRTAFHDTVVFVDPKSESVNIYLRPLFGDELMEVRKTDSLKQVEDLGLTRLLVSKEQQAQARELNFLEERKIQVSLIPGTSTNKSVSGIAVNEVSLNIFAGYQGGLNGFELGGIANLIRKDAKGFQGAGITNLVGGNTNGVQMAGVVNNTLGSFNGAQLSGLANVVWDTLTGIQVTGGINMLRGGMKGAQISGLGNITTEDCDGAQVSGGFNITVGDVTSFQASGLLNYGKNVMGSQFSAGINITPGDVSGGQLGLLSNYAQNVEGGQIGLINVASQKTVGRQVGLINYSARAEGGQLGLLNFSDTITGVSIGFLSMALHGYHRGEVYVNEMMPLNVSFRTGVSEFYNVFSYGRSLDSINYSLDSNDYWAAGYGFGAEINWPKKHTVNIELTANHINERKHFIEALNLVGRLDAIYNFTIIDRITISAGPSFNVLFSNWQDAETGDYLTSIAPHKLFEEETSELLMQGWIGWRAGVGVRF